MHAVVTNAPNGLIILFLCLLLGIGATASPFSKWLRFKNFGDSYRWRGFNREDLIPLGKTLLLSSAFLAGAVSGGLMFLNKTGVLYKLLLAYFFTAIVGTAGFSIWYSLWKMRHVRKNRREEERRT